VFEINKGVLRPEAPPELVAGDNGAWLFKQGSQHLERLRLKPDLHTAFAEHTFLQVNFEGPEVNDAGFSAGRLHGRIIFSESYSMFGTSPEAESPILVSSSAAT
jgi:hypothetical protein